MKKKINPKDQTKELSRAKWGALKRNPEKLKGVENKFRDAQTKFEEKQKEYINLFNNPRTKAICEKMGIYQIVDYEEFKKNHSQRPAAVCDKRYYIYREYLPTSSKMTEKELNKDLLDLLKHDADQIFQNLTYNEPINTLLVGIDLRRTKKAIKAEVESLVDENQKLYRQKESKAERLKYLATIDECFEVWDLYDRAGKQPPLKTYKQIARSVKRPLSTVKSQWRRAHIFIKGFPYDPKFNYSTPERKLEGEDFCGKCLYKAKCYIEEVKDFVRGGRTVSIKHMVWKPEKCSAYLEIVGKDKQAEFENEFLPLEEFIDYQKANIGKRIQKKPVEY